MNNENYLFNMIWGADPSGYEISQVDHTIQPKQGKKWKTYNPFLDHPTLARQFSKIALSRKSVSEKDALKFANNYGLLGFKAFGMDAENLHDWYEAISAFKYLFKQVDKGDQDEALYFFTGMNIAPAMRLKITNEKQIWKRSLQMVPATLYGAMWLMAANEIVSGAQYQKCKVKECSEWFVVRPNRKYCSEACKQAAYRNRH